jgi:hypothetical protein
MFCTEIRSLLTMTLAGIALCCSPPALQAQENPVEAAQRCLARVEQLVSRCENVAAEETQRCLHEIRRLKADGQDEAAIEVARECVARSRQRTRLCSAEIREICTRCIDYLLQFGLEDLAHRIRYNCGAAIDQLETIHARVENAIQQALNG